MFVTSGLGAVLEGNLYPPPEGRFAIVTARFNRLVTEALLAGCLETLLSHGISRDRVDAAWVPGSFELPLIAARMARSRRYRAVICLGCVIRGETGHYDHVAGQAASGIQHAALSSDVPVIFGVLTTDTVEQALNRAGLKAGNKGHDAALAALEMINLGDRLNQHLAGLPPRPTPVLPPEPAPEPPPVQPPEPPPIAS